MPTVSTCAMERLEAVVRLRQLLAAPSRSAPDARAPARYVGRNATGGQNHHFNGAADVGTGAFGVGELWNWTINH